MYLLDANVFIQSHRAHYGLDFVPAFWDWLDRSSASGILCSIRPISAEIEVGDDDLSTWAAKRPGLFVPVDSACGPSLATVANWAQSGQFSQAAVSNFLSVADYQLVAYAHAHRLTVVTMEKSEPTRTNKIKVPDACIAHDVNWVTPFQMLRGESASFILAP